MNFRKNYKPQTFFDFCAGIGGGRIALENNGLKCVGFSEIDKQAEKTYRLFFDSKSKEKNYGDLTKIYHNQLPQFDIMIAGFPCQPFSIVGKRVGTFDNRGKIIFSLIHVLKNKNIPYFILENVKGLVNHNKGETLKYILQMLEQAGYTVQWQVLNSLDYGLAQMRERIYFVGIRQDIITQKQFLFPAKRQQQTNIKEFLNDTQAEVFNHEHSNYTTFLRYLDNKYNKGRFDLDKLLKQDYLVIDTRQSDLRIYQNKVPTLRFGRQGIFYVKNKLLYKLTGYETLLLQGFPKSLARKAKEHIKISNILKQTGNAMSVNPVEDIVKELLNLVQYKPKAS